MRETRWTFICIHVTLGGVLEAYQLVVREKEATAEFV
jgi:hypothetical protein